MQSMLPRISIIILNYDGLTDTLHCLESLKNAHYIDFEVIVLDNGSPENDVKILSEYKMKNYRFINNKKNLGFAGGCNNGIELVLKERKCKYIYLLNNDTEVDKEFLSESVIVAEKSGKIGIVASKSLYFDNREIIENAGHLMLNSGDEYSRGRGEPSARYNERTELLSACAAGILLRSDMVREIGLFDEEFFLIYEDVDLTFRAVVMGWKCIYLPKSIIYHKVSTTIKKNRNYEMTLRAQVNQFKAYLHNVPIGVFILNLPFVILRFFTILIGGLIFGQFRMVKIFLHAHWLLLKEIGPVYSKRKSVMSRRKVGFWYVFMKQRNFLPYYLKYFWEIVLTRKRKSIF